MKYHYSYHFHGNRLSEKCFMQLKLKDETLPVHRRIFKKVGERRNLQKKFLAPYKLPSSDTPFSANFHNFTGTSTFILALLLFIFQSYAISNTRRKIQILLTITSQNLHIKRACIKANTGGSTEILVHQTSKMWYIQ